ncbi:MAG TPA: hypothetical protein DFR83_22400, partial [Deltaproteobacteria bacterium]|nr:hypothetical protein [Deltaproteobacteria bacterium]
MRLSLPCLAATTALVLSSRVTYAQDAVKVEFVRVGQEGQASPAFIVKPRVTLDDLTVEIRCGSTRASRSGAVEPGRDIRLELAVPRGDHRCSGTLSIRSPDGSEGTMPLSFNVTMHPPLAVNVPRDSVDLSGRTLSVVLDRPAKSVKVEVVGPGGIIIGHGRNDAGPFSAGSAVPLT